MMVGARFGLLILLAGLAPSALAQDRPEGAWQDPPAREAPADRGEGPVANGQAVSSEAGTGRSETATRGRRRLTERRARLRRAAAERRRMAEHGAREDGARRRGRRPARSAARRPAYERSAAAPAAPRPGRRSAVYRGRFSERFVYVEPHPLVQFRNEGWGTLLRPTRAQRIADAQAQGYLVLRARTFVMEDGSRVRALTPYHPVE